MIKLNKAINKNKKYLLLIYQRSELLDKQNMDTLYYC